MQKRFQLILLILIIVIVSCDNNSTNSNKPVARVYNSYLYLDEIMNSTPEYYNSIDSTDWSNSYIDNWIKKQLLLRKAELSLSDKKKNVSKELNNYRSTLLIHRYEENLIKLQLDTIITVEDVEAYYDEFNSEFRLKIDYVKTIYVRIPKSSPDFIKIKKWYKSDNEEDLNDLEDYCFQNGLEFNFDNYWEQFSDVLARSGYKVRTDNKIFLERNTLIEKRDSVYRYFVCIKDYRLVNEIAPLLIVSNDIKKIIINKRKIQLIEKAENEIYQEVSGKNVVEKFKL